MTSSKGQSVVQAATLCITIILTVSLWPEIAFASSQEHEQSRNRTLGIVHVIFPNDRIVPLIMIGDQNLQMGGLVAQTGSAEASDHFDQQIKTISAKDMPVPLIFFRDKVVLTSAYFKGMPENNPEHMWYSNGFSCQFRQS